MEFRFTKADRQQMKSLGISPALVFQQIDTFKRSDFSIKLKRPCVPGNGVHRIGDHELSKYTSLHAAAAGQGRFMKFVPASGAATRMFQSLLQIFYLPQYLEKDELQRRLDQRVSIACDFKAFIDQLDRFPFIRNLKEALACDGHLLQEVVCEGRFRMLLEYLLTDRGLGYGALPKAMLAFHSYPEESRTAFEEQIAESVEYLCSHDGNLKLHFTIPEGQMKSFLALSEDICRRYSDICDVAFDISFSFQKSSTNTIAVDMNGLPFRDRLGRIHFRPAGHGALIENLNDLNADLVYIKNVDNVVPDRLKGPVCFWKKALGGYLVSLQQTIHSLLNRMKGADSCEAVRDAAGFVVKDLLFDLPFDFEVWPEEKKRSLLMSILDRPIRVCGVVPNAGEPGGAPFWVENEAGGLSAQIIEKAQVDLNSLEQNAIWNSSTHFNPVDIVCSVRNSEGKPFDLTRFIDPKAVIITRKSIDGTDVQALELPGLWNGSMANWITVFIEVPAMTFNPVKTFFDLLRPEHQSQELILT